MGAAGVGVGGAVGAQVGDDQVGLPVGVDLERGGDTVPGVAELLLVQLVDAAVVRDDLPTG